MATRAAFVHESLLVADPSFDHRAPGGAITVALCGSMDHDGPCPLAPHHTTVERSETDAVVRVVFVCNTGDELRVRERVDAALASGSFRGPDPDGSRSTWRCVSSHAGNLHPDELRTAEHLSNTRAR